MPCAHALSRRDDGSCVICDASPLDDWSPDAPLEDPLADIVTAYEAHACRQSLSRFVRQAWRVLFPATPLEWNWHIEVVCEHVQATIEELMRARRDRSYVMKWQHLLVNEPPRSGKPCYSRGMVVEKSRGLVELGTIKVGDEVLTHRGRFRRVLAVHEQGVLPLYEVRTKRGRVVKTAADHPYLTARGWVQAQHLTTRDVLAEVRSQETCGTRTIPLEEARLLGYLIGDGHVKYGGTSFTNMDPETVADFMHCAQAVGFLTRTRARAPSYPNPQNKLGLPTQMVIVSPPRPTACECGSELPSPLALSCVPCRQRGRNQRAAELRARRRGEHVDAGAWTQGWRSAVRDWRKKHDIDGRNSYDKRIPRAVMEGDEQVAAEFLAAYWACDGEIHDRRDLPRSRRDDRPGAVRVGATTVSEGLARDLQALFNRLGLGFTVRRHVAHLKTARQGAEYVYWRVTAEDQDTCADFMQSIGPRMRHEKRGRASGLQRTDFDRALRPDPIVSVEQSGKGDCRCLTVEEDSSFSYEGVAVHNTIIVGIMLPAWIWTLDPAISYRYVSGNPRMVSLTARATRDLIQSTWYRHTFEPQWSLRRDIDAVGVFANTARGARWSSSLGADIVGEGTDIIVMDDPTDPLDAHSEAMLEKARVVWNEAIASRIEQPRAHVMLGIMQRLNEGDWSALVLEQDWRHLCIQMVKEETAPCKCADCAAGVTCTGWADVRRPGESLHPARFSDAHLAAERKRLGSFGWAGQMQQRPSPEGGGIFKHNQFPRIDPGDLPRFSDLAIFCDLTFGADTVGTSRNALGLAGRVGAKRYLIDMVARPMNVGDIKAEIVRLHRLATKQWPTAPVRTVIEKKAAGAPVASELRRGALLPSGEIVQLPGVVEYDPGSRDKFSRAMSVQPMVEAGDLVLVKGGWVEEFLHELGAFPNSPFNDQVDVVSMMLDFWRQHTAGAERLLNAFGSGVPSL